MKLINNIKNPDAKFDLYFLAYDSPTAVSPGSHWTDREGIIELYVASLALIINHRS
jgi:lactoylglutathione lyase